MKLGVPDMALCPNTQLTIPECSCSRCLEEQVRRAAPALLDAHEAPTLEFEPPPVLRPKRPGALLRRLRRAA